MIASTWSLRWFCGFKVMASRPALGVALIGETPITDTTPVTSASLRMMASISFCSALHFVERDVGCGFGHRGDQAGVLQRQEAFRA